MSISRTGRLVGITALLILSVIVMGVAFTGSAAAVPDEGSGTSDDPYLIDDWNDLDQIRDNPGAHYELANDPDEKAIGYDSVVDPNGAGFNPMTLFYGTFDGNGHVIRDLVIDTDGFGGLFEQTGASESPGEIRDLGLEKYVTGEIQSGDGTLPATGGLVGSTNGDISQSFSTADVTDPDNVGGLVGKNGATIEKSYATGNINTSGFAGGLAGNNNLGTITNSYATGNVDSFGRGGLVGDGANGELKDSYWDKGTTNQDGAFGSGGGAGSGVVGFGSTGDTEPADEMIGDNASTNMSALDFTNTWQKVTENKTPNTVVPKNDSYPILTGIAAKPQLNAQDIETQNITNLDTNKEYNSLQTAINEASEEDVIGVADPGPYNQIVIDRDTDATNLTIRAAEGVSPTITHDAPGGEPTVAIDQDNVTLEGFTINRTGSSNVGQAVRVSGTNVDLTNNTYEVSAAGDAAVAVLTDSSGAADNPSFEETINDVSISGGEIITEDSSQTGVLVADDGAAEIVSDSVDISGVTFTANADSTHVLELNTGGGIVDTEATLTNNTFDRAVAPGVPNASVNEFNIDGIVTSTGQAAIDTAGEGSTIEFSAGEYDPIAISDTHPENLTIQPVATDPVTIAQNADTGTPTVAINQNGTTITGVTVDRGGESRNIAQGIRIAASNVTVTEATVRHSNNTDTTDNGVLISDRASGDSQVENNVTNVTIEDTTVADFPTGVAVATQKDDSNTVNQLTISNTTLNNNTIGVGFSQVETATDLGDELVIDNTTFDQNGVGVYIFGDEDNTEFLSFDNARTDGISITNNEFRNPNTNLVGSGQSPFHIVNNGVEESETAEGPVPASIVADNDAFDGAVRYEDDLVAPEIQPVIDYVANNSDSETKTNIIEVSDDTYTESLTLDVDNTTLNARSPTTKPTIRSTVVDRSPTIDIVASDVTVNGFDVKRTDGEPFSQAIAVRATSNVTISNTTVSESDGAQPTQGILITDDGGDREINTNTRIINSEASGFDHGIAISTQDTTDGGIDNTTITGSTLESNAIGVKISDFSDTNEPITANISNNTIVNNEDGIHVLNKSKGPAGTEPAGVTVLDSVTATNNNLSANTNAGVVNLGTGDTLNATRNWWGDATGPSGDGSGSGASVSSNVTFEPFYTDAARTTLSSDDSQLYAGGSGNASDPYQIANWTHLNNTRKNLDANFTLVNTLNESSDGYTSVASESANGGNGFVPIGGGEGRGGKFSGMFNGSGQSITGLTIDRPSDRSIGLFGSIAPGAEIRSINLRRINITGAANVGSITGISDGIIVDSTATGNITGNNPDNYLSGNEIGGIVGDNRGIIKLSNASVNVTSDGNATGGLAGTNTGDITLSYATGNVSGLDRVGGVVGDNTGGTGNITQSYATGDVNGSYAVGGLVGNNQGNNVSKSYVAGTITGDDSINSVIGDNGGPISDLYADIEVTGQDTPSSRGLSTSELKTNSSLSGFDFTNTWDVVDDGTNISYPYLRNNTQQPAPGIQTTTNRQPTASIDSIDSVSAGDSAVTADVSFADTVGGNITVDVVDSSDSSISSATETVATNGSVAVSLSRSVSNEDIDVVVYETDGLNNELARQTETVPQQAQPTPTPTPTPDPANFEVSLTAPNSVTVGESVSVTATVENTGDQTGSQPITFVVDGAQLESETVSALEAGNSQQLTFSYTTDTDDVPEIDIEVEAGNDDSASDTVTVTEPAAPSFAVTSLNTPDAVTTGETIDVSATIENAGGQTGEQIITLSVDGTQEASETVSLGAGESDDVVFSYTTSTADTPDTTLTVSSENDSASRTVSVAEPAVASFAVTNLTAPQSVTAGNEIAVSATIENTGGAAGTQQVGFRVDGSQEAVTSVTLGAGERTTESFTYAVSESATTQLADVAVGTANATRSTEVQINGTLDRTPLSLEANQTTLVSGESVAFTVTDDTGTPVEATVQVAGTEQQTGTDGRVTIPIETPGQYDAVATKAQTTDTEFAPATLGLTVSDPTLTISQQTVTFGDVRVGSAETTNLTVSNTAPTSISVDSLGVTGSGADAFSINTDLSNEIPANTDQKVNVTFDPDTPEASDATLRINDQTVSLSGAGTAPELRITTELPIELTADPGSSNTTSVTISNDGTAPLSADLSSGDRFTQPEELTVNAGATETFDIEFTPQDSDSASVSTRLTVAPESESLSPTTIPIVGTVVDREISLQTASVTLGNATVGETTTAGVVIDNSGTTTETLTATTDTSAFEVAPEDTEVTLAPGDQAFLSIEATPTEPGEITDSLTVETDDGAVSDTASLTAVGQAPDVDIGTDSVAFGTTPLNSTTTQAVEVTNEGDALLTVDVDETLGDGQFTPVDETQLRIPAGESRSLPVGFTPQTAGETTADVTLTTNDPETQQTTIELTGEGIETNVGLSPSTVSFGTVGVSTSTTETVTLANDGSSFTIDGVTVDDTAFTADTDLDGTTVAEDETVELDLVFDPTTSGSRTGTVTVSGSTDTDNTDVSAALTGTGQTGDLEVSSQTLRTGVTVADGTTTGSISIENTGLPGTQLSIDEVTLNDTNQFSLSEAGLIAGATIDGGTQQPIVVAFEPTSPDDGVAETTLTLEASSGEQTFTRTISVTGTVSAPEPTVSTETLAVETIPVSDTTERTVTVANEGGEPFSIESVDSGAEGVTAKRLGSSEVVPGDERTIAVAVNQSTAGTIDTTVDITTTAAGDLSVDVTGEVVAPEFSIATESVEFDETSTGSAAQQTVTIDNTGAAPLTVASPTISGPDSPAFSILSGDQRLRISANSSETITLGFAPDTTGEQTATLAIEPGNDPTVDEPTEITLTGTGTASDVGLNESAIGFGTIQPDSTQVESLTLTNDGNEPVEITGSSVTGSESSAVSVTGLQQRILQPGDSEPFDIEVVTTGIDRGSLSAQVRISTADETVASSIGATVASPELSVRGTPNPEAFGTTRIGDTTTAGVDIENTGNADLDLADITTTGTDAAAFSVVEQPAEPISSQSSDQLVVEFDPEALPNAAERAQNTPLEASAILEIDHNAGSTQSVDLTAEAETAALTTPRTFQFGETPIGTTTTRELTIENTPSATTDITVTGVELSGSDADEYGAVLTGGEAPITLTPGGETTVNVSLAPESFDRKFATLSVQTEDPRQPAQKVGLSNAETVYTVEYGSVNVQYINPTSGQEPTVDVDRGLHGQNATVTSTTSDVDRTEDYQLDYEFGTAAAEAGGQTALDAETPVQYINATTTAQTGEFNDSTIQIEVSKAVLASQNTTPENVTIYHEDGDGYEPLETTRLFETRQGQVYEVTTDSYSLFAVGVEPSDDDEGSDGDDNESSGGDDGDSDGGDGDDGEDSDSGSSGGGGSVGVPPSATDGTGVDEPDISSDLGEQATITAESEPIITEQNETRSTATFAESFPLLEAVTFTKTGPFADDIEGTVNARAIDGDPAATGTPDGITVSLAHVTMPDQNMSEVEIKYELPENRLDELGASADGLTVHRFDGSNWQNIDVEVTEEAETDTVLTVELSNPTTTYLALTTPVADAGTTNEEISDQSTDSNRTVDDGSIPGFGIAAALLAIVTIVAVLSRQQ